MKQKEKERVIKKLKVTAFEQEHIYKSKTAATFKDTSIIDRYIINIYA